MHERPPTYSHGSVSLPALQTRRAIDQAQEAEARTSGENSTLIIMTGYRTNRLMLTPLDGVEVDPFLDKLPQRAELAQEGDSVLDSFEDVVDLRVGREAADTESNTAVRTLVAVAECS